MSDLILPGDPPPTALRQQIAALQHEVMRLRAGMGKLTGILGDVVAACGDASTLYVAPSEPGRFRLTIEPQPEGAHIIRRLSETPGTDLRGSNHDDADHTQDGYKTN